MNNPFGGYQSASVPIKNIKSFWVAGMCGMMRSTAAVLHWSWVNKAVTVSVGVCQFSVCVCGETPLCTSLSVCLTVGGYVQMHIGTCANVGLCMNVDQSSIKIKNVDVTLSLYAPRKLGVDSQSSCIQTSNWRGSKGRKATCSLHVGPNSVPITMQTVITF